LDQQTRVTGGQAADPQQAEAHHDPQHSAKLQRLIARARAYHARHADWVKEFNTLTHGKCADGADGISYRLLRNWQAEQHVSVDGLLGPDTLEKARHLSEHAHKEEAKHESPAPKVEHHDPEARQIAHEAESNVHQT